MRKKRFVAILLCLLMLGSLLPVGAYAGDDAGGENAPQTCTVTYKVLFGSWADGTKEDKTETVAYGAHPANIPTGMTPETGRYNGEWLDDPDRPITEDVRFEYFFRLIGNAFSRINNIPACDGYYVWMGGDSPIKWHIIGQGDSNWLLIAAEPIGGEPNWMDWNSALDLCETVLSGFTDMEQAAIPVTDKSEPDTYSYRSSNGYNFGPSHVHAKLFLLSAEEAETYFSSDAARQPGWWWLRSPSGNTEIGAVCPDGDLTCVPAQMAEIVGARPAFQFDRSSIFLESAAEGGKSAAAPGSGQFGTFSGSSGEGGNEIKLTLKDDSRSGFIASASDPVVSPGGTMELRYSGAVTGENEYVSAALCDASGKILYYASLTPDASGSGVWNMAIPEGLAAGNYTIQVFSEQQNGDRKTDYAGPPVSIGLTVPGAPFTVTYRVINGAWADGTTEDRTETVLCWCSPADVPMGMVPSPGYDSGYWDADPAGVTVTEDMTFTYTCSVSLVNGIPAADGNDVWMGTLEDAPVKWHIIGADSGRYLLISADVLGGEMTWEAANGYCDTVFSGFSAPEQAAVPRTSKSEPEDYMYRSKNRKTFAPSTVDGNLFLLSAEEAEAYFDSDAAREPGLWWLRQLGYGFKYFAGLVESNGRLNLGGIYALHGLRPAFQLDRSAVLLESAAEGAKSSAAPGSGQFGTLSGPSGEDGNEIKLTLIDGSRTGFTASASGTAVSPGGTLAVRYSGAEAGTGRYVSAVLCDSNGAVLYYASLTPDSSGSGTWNMTLPAELAEGSYTLKVFSEQQNGDKKTDYAGIPSEIELTIGGFSRGHVAPAANTVTYKVVGGTWADGTTEDKTETVARGSCPAGVPTGMKPNLGYTGGAWDTDPAVAKITGPATFTYTFTNVDSGGGAEPSQEGKPTVKPASASSGGGANTYLVTVTDVENGTVTVDRKTAPANARVTLTVKPDEGWQTAGVTVTDARGNEIPVTKNDDGSYSFTMPAMGVTAEPEIRKTETPAPDIDEIFVDVPSDAWYHDAVYWAVERGITNGVDSTHFAPDITCTRAQMVTFLWRAAGQPEPTGTENPFSDIPADAYYIKAVLWAVEKGIAKGIDAGRFAPDATVTRAQTVTFLYRYEQSIGGGFIGARAFPLNFSDASDVPEWAYEAFCWMTMNGIVQGSGGRLLPKDDCTRAQIVTMIMRVFTESAEQ